VAEDPEKAGERKVVNLGRRAKGEEMVELRSVW
jgi:hypothetical protein